ncbi:MAG: hypothetical protein ACXW3L_11820, partial [Limisphaerales bacterium]
MRATLLAVFASCSPLLAAEIIFVSPNGSDNASGLNQETPVASLQTALDRAAEHKAREVQFVAGHYKLEAPVRITPKHSGADDRSLLVRAQDQAKVVLSGGK